MDIQWRSIVKFVAIVQWVFTSIHCIALTIFLIGVIIWSPIAMFNYMTKNVDPSTYNQTEQNDILHYREANIEAAEPWINAIIWFFLATCVPLSILDVITCWKLWTACHLRCPLNESVRKARFWRNIRFFYFVITLVYICICLYKGTTSLGILSGMWIGLRLFCDILGLIAVQEFINTGNAIIFAPINEMQWTR